MRIAIVDDLAAERTLLKDRLEWQLQRRNVQADILEYESGETFLEAAREAPFTAAFLDIYMDGMTGMEAAKPPTAAQYFKIFKPISWGERPAERRSRFIQRFPRSLYHSVSRMTKNRCRNSCQNRPFRATALEKTEWPFYTECKQDAKSDEGRREICVSYCRAGRTGSRAAALRRANYPVL